MDQPERFSIKEKENMVYKLRSQFTKLDKLPENSILSLIRP